MTAAVRPHLSHPKYRADIDGLRALAVLSVVVFHAFPSWLGGGFVGVDIFFVISGFLISTIILENIEKGTFSFSEFYARRIKRIFPALLLVLLATAGLGWFLLLDYEYKQLGEHIAAGAAFISNLVLWSEVGYFDNAAETKPLLHLWSLGIEEQFYILWPLLLWAIAKWGWNCLAAMALLAAASFVANLASVDQDAVAAFYSPLTRFWELACGGLLAWMSLRKLHANPQSGNCDIRVGRAVIDHRDLSNASSLLGLLLIGCSFWLVRKDVSFPGWWAVVPVMGAVLVIAAGAQAWANRLILSNKLAVWFGLISFPLYLWHWPLLSLARIIESGTPAREVRMAAVLVAVILAWLTYKFLERPIRFGPPRHARTRMLVLLMLAVGCGGYLIHSRDGLKSRPIAERTAAISEAKADWHYDPTELVGGKIVGIHHLRGQRADSVLFAGSSLMGQYYPRAEQIYANRKPRLSVMYASRNHCTPIPLFDVISGPENINCQDYYRAALELARSERVVKVVFGANWPDFYAGGVLTESAKLFVRDLAELKQLGKQVYIIAKPPIYPGFDPTVLVKPLRRGHTTHLEDRVVERRQIEDLDSLEQLRKISLLTGAVIINPYDYVCGESNCPIVRNGQPLYNDSAHMRTRYAASDATFVDELVGAD